MQMERILSIQVTVVLDDGGYDEFDAVHVATRELESLINKGAFEGHDGPVQTLTYDIHIEEKRA